jgi:hypothetical protein
MSKQISSEAVTIFVDRLVEEKKFENLDLEVLDQIKADLNDRVEDRINAVILEHMPPDKLEDFNKLLDSEDAEKIQLFCQENVKNLDNVIAKGLLDFRSSYLNS